MKTTDYILNWLSENLTEKKYKHSLGAALCAQKLAKIYNQDEDKAYLAGLVHDCAKNQDDFKLMEIIKNEIKTGYLDSELKNPKTYHAIAGAYFVKTIFEIDDNEIISAVRNHTIGSVDMTLFDKIIFIALQGLFNIHIKHIHHQTLRFAKQKRLIIKIAVGFKDDSDTAHLLADSHTGNITGLSRVRKKQTAQNNKRHCQTQPRPRLSKYFQQIFHFFSVWFATNCSP